MTDRAGTALVVQVPSRTEFLAVVREIAFRVARGAGFNKSASEQISLAVDEAVTNVIEHAYGGAPDRVVELRFEDRGPDLQVDVVDDGATMDPKSMPKVDLDKYASEGRKGGLGVHLMNQIMDSVTFGRSSDKNVCCLVRHKPEPAGSSGEAS